VRINLVGDSRTQNRWLKGRKRRGRRRSLVFDSAISMPQAARRDSGRRKRAKDTAGKARKKAGRGQAVRTRTARSRAERRQRAQHAAAASSAGILQRIRWRSVGWRLLALVVMAGLIGVIAYVSSDFSFFVYRDGTRVEGARFLRADKIFAASGVNEQNIFWIDPGKVAERIVALDGVKAARVRCDLPALVTIEVEEREPVVMWRATSQNQDLWLDEAGVVLPYHGDVNSPNMVFVVDYGERHLEVGDRIEPDGIVQSVLQLAAALPGEQVYYYQPDRGLSFTHRVSSGQWPVYVGTSDDLARKIQVVQGLTEYLVANNISPRYVDVRWAEHPVYGKPQGDTLVGGN
jgi:cell division septal protein FtsQ